MPRTAHRLDAADLLELGTYSLRRALDSHASLTQRLAAEQERARSLPEEAPRPGQLALTGRAQGGSSS